MITEQNYFDHEADIGIIGYGHTLEDCFTNAAEAMFGLMTNIKEIQAKNTIQFEFTESDVELAFITWLNQLIAIAAAQNLALGHFKVIHLGNSWHGEASGQIWDKNLEHGVEVKGATLTMLSVTEKNGEWQAKCVVDV